MLMILHAYYHCRLDAYIVNTHHKFVHKMEETDQDIQLLGVGNMSEVFFFSNLLYLPIFFLWVCIMLVIEA